MINKCVDPYAQVDIDVMKEGIASNQEMVNVITIMLLICECGMAFIIVFGTFFGVLSKMHDLRDNLNANLSNFRTQFEDMYKLSKRKIIF